MKNFKLLFAVGFLAVTLALGACKKYEEGPAVSLRTKKARVTGSWVVAKFIKNGENIPDLKTAGYVDFIMSFYRDKTGKFTYGKFVDNFEWDFTDKKNAIKIRAIRKKKWTEYTILKLQNNEMWLRFEKEGQTRELHYVKI